MRGPGRVVRCRRAAPCCCARDDPRLHVRRPARARRASDGELTAAWEIRANLAPHAVDGARAHRWLWEIGRGPGGRARSRRDQLGRGLVGRPRRACRRTRGAHKLGGARIVSWAAGARKVPTTVAGVRRGPRHRRTGGGLHTVGAALDCLVGQHRQGELRLPPQSAATPKEHGERRSRSPGPATRRTLRFLLPRAARTSSRWRSGRARGRS